MRYDVGEYVYIRHHSSYGLLKIVGLETEWQGCVERISRYKLKVPAGVLNVLPSDVGSKAELFAEKLAGKLS